MHITAPRRPVALGLALAGAVALAGGTTAAVTARATATPATHTQQVVRQVAEPSVTSPAATSPTTPTAAPASPTAPAAQSPAAAVHPVTLAQAVALATSRTHAQLDQVETESGPAGLDYDVKLVRADGTELEVTVAAQTGQVVADDAADSAAQPSDTPESDQAGDAPDGSDG